MRALSLDVFSQQGPRSFLFYTPDFSISPRAISKTETAGTSDGEFRYLLRPSAREALAAGAQRAAKNFAVGSLGQLRQEFDLMRHLVGRDHAAHVLADFLSQRFGARVPLT
jgi:hypothetical protein